MTKIVNLDQLVTKRDKVVVLNGKEHEMKTLTVKDYVLQMKAASQINEMVKAGDESIESAERVIELTVEALMKVFPTITKDEFEALNMEQLTAIRGLAEDFAAEDAPEPEAGE